MKPFVHPDIIKEATADPVMDFNFDPDRETNTGIFYTCYTMKDNRLECAGWYKFRLGCVKQDVLN